MGHGLKVVQEKSIVGVTQGQNVAQIVKEAISFAGSLEKLVSGKKVLIKPNLSVALPAETGVTTDPQVVRALIHICREAGAKEILVGESAVVNFDAGEIIAALKVKELFEESGGKVVNLDQDQQVEVMVPGGQVLDKIKVWRTAYESDVIISVPKMKTHLQTKVTLSLKNMKGTIPDESKKIIHRIGIPADKREENGLDRAIVDLNKVISADLAVIDATIALDGFVPGPRLVGTPVRLDTIIAGFDPVAVDAVACRIMGIEPEKVRHIRLAFEQKLGKILPEEIEIIGQRIESICRPFKTEIQQVSQSYKNISIIEGSGCSGCAVTSRLALSFFSPEELSEWETITIITGEISSEQLTQGKCIFIGNCALRSNKGEEGLKIGGCPPPGFFIRRSLESVERKRKT